jgi:predicted dehydrogenase
MDKSGPLRWGLLGTARINRALIDPIRSSKNSFLSAVASRSSKKAEEYANAWKIPYYYSSYEALLADPDIDVIYNSLPNGLHTEWSIKAMTSGKHVLCEKPLTCSSMDMDAVMETASHTGKVISEAFMYRHHPQTVLAKQMIDDGEIGNPKLIRASFCYTNTRTSDPRFDPGLGGGSLWDVGCYPISYARYLTGEEPIQVFGHQTIGPTGVDVLFAGQMQFPGDVTTQFDCSFITPFRAFMEITGDKGRLTISNPFKPGMREKIYLEREGVTKTIHIKGKELYCGEVEDIENAVLFGKPSRISLGDSKANVAAIEALIQSAQTGQVQVII